MTDIASFTRNGRASGPILEAACGVHARRPFSVMADLAENAPRKAKGRKPAVISPLALEEVRRIDALFEIERAINERRVARRGGVRQDFECGPGRRTKQETSSSA